MSRLKCCHCHRQFTRSESKRLYDSDLDLVADYAPDHYLDGVMGVRQQEGSPKCD